VAHGFIGTIIVIVMLIDSPPPVITDEGFLPSIAVIREKKWVFPQVWKKN
jgi:hypothetical protein